MMISVIRGTACRWDGGEKVTATSRLGRTWWLWVPYARLRHLRNADGIYFTEAGASWLCFFAFVNVYWKTHRSDFGQANDARRAETPGAET